MDTIPKQDTQISKITSQHYTGIQIPNMEAGPSENHNDALNQSESTYTGEPKVIDELQMGRTTSKSLEDKITLIIMGLCPHILCWGYVGYDFIYGPLSFEHGTCGLREGNNFNHFISSILFAASWFIFYFAPHIYSARKVVKLPEVYNADSWVECIEDTFQNLETYSHNKVEDWKPNKNTQDEMQSFATFVTEPEKVNLHPCNRTVNIFLFTSHMSIMVLFAVDRFTLCCEHDTSPLDGYDLGLIVYTIIQALLLAVSGWYEYISGWGSKMRSNAERIRARMDTGMSKEEGSSQSIDWWQQQLTRLVSEEIKMKHKLVLEERQNRRYKYRDERSEERA